MCHFWRKVGEMILHGLSSPLMAIADVNVDMEVSTKLLLPQHSITQPHWFNLKALGLGPA